MSSTACAYRFDSLDEIDACKDFTKLTPTGLSGLWHRLHQAPSPNACRGTDPQDLGMRLDLETGLYRVD